MEVDTTLDSKPEKSSNPPKTQVIKSKNGVVETLHKGFLDLRKLGPITMRRSSEIKLDEETQKYYIEFLEPELTIFNQEYRTYFFDTYDLAVEREVKFINWARKNGLM
jgi:hypothetical protein